MTYLAPLVGLYSPAPRSGKSTIAAGLAGFGYRTVRFAGPLKAMLRALLTEAGEPADAVDPMIEGDLKQSPCAALAGETPRWAMQTLGTEWGRKLIADDLWVRLFLRGSFLLREAGTSVVCDDMRFPNEAEAIRAAGGILVRIERPGAAAPNGHTSEGALEDWDFDLRITNDAGCATAFALDWAPRVSAAACAVR